MLKNLRGKFATIYKNTFDACDVFNFWDEIDQDLDFVIVLELITGEIISILLTLATHLRSFININRII